MKKQIARWLVVCLVAGSTPAWAQTMEENKVSGCTRSNANVENFEMYGIERWNALPAESQVTACHLAKARTLPMTPLMSEPPMRSQKLAIAGFVTVLAGVILVLPQGTNYSILGDTFCVNTYSVDSGSCQSPAPMIGLAAIGAGTVMMIVGMHVSVAPMVTKQTKGVSATVKW